MKINSSPLKNLPPAIGKRVTADAPAPSGTGAGGGNHPVSLSATGRTLAQLESSAGDINTVRVSEIRDALAAGTLKINPEAIADGLLDSARELLGPSR